LELSIFLGSEIVVTGRLNLISEASVVRPERSGVAALEDQFLAIDDGLLKGISLSSHLSNLNVLALNSFSLLSCLLKSSIFLCLLVGLNLISASLHVSFQFSNLSLSLVFKSDIKVSAVLFELLLHLLDLVDSVILELLFSLHGSLVLTLCLCACLSLTIKSGEATELLILSFHCVFKVFFLIFHLRNSGFLLFGKIILVLSHLGALRVSHLFENVSHHSVRQEASKDFSLLSNLLLLNYSDLVRLTVHSLGLDITSN